MPTRTQTKTNQESGHESDTEDLNNTIVATMEEAETSKRTNNEISETEKEFDSEPDDAMIQLTQRKLQELKNSTQMY